MAYPYDIQGLMGGENYSPYVAPAPAPTAPAPDPLQTYRSEIQNYGTWTPQLESAAQAYMQTPEYAKRVQDALSRYKMSAMMPSAVENFPSFESELNNPLSPYAVNPYVLGSTWDGNVQTINYIDGTSHVNAPYEEGGGFMVNMGGDIIKGLTIGALAAGTGYVGGGLAGLWGAPAAGAGGAAAGAGAGGAGMFTPAELALGTSGASFTGGVPGITTAAATAAGASSLMGGFTAEELALAGSGASFTGGVGPMTGLIGGTGAAAATGGLTALQKYLLAQQGINAVKGIAGGGGAVPTGGGYGAGNYGAGTGGELLKSYKYPTYVQNQQPTINLAGLQKPAKTWQAIAMEAKQNQKGYYGGYLA